MTSVLLKSGRDHFPNTIKHFGDRDIVFRKGIYPYEYCKDEFVFELAELPPKEAFHSKLNETDITDADYASAQQAWRIFNCQTFKDYHDHYMTSDVLLLADVFENFRDISLTNFGLDPAHYYTLPGLAWDSALKQTGVKLSLMSDIDMHLFIENNIRGGISMISERYAKANNKYLIDEPFDPTKPTSFIQYLDMNGLYSTVMSRFNLPVSDFKFWTADEIKDGLDVTKIGEDSETGYILEVDIEYPESLHELHSMYPLAVDKLTVTDAMLSPYALSFTDRPRPTEKLVPNLMNKSHYVVHYMNLKLYLQLGLRVTTTHRVLEFKQEAWIRPFVNHCTNMRKQSIDEFSKSFWKLVVNAVYGKSMENLRNRVDVRLISKRLPASKVAAKPQFVTSRIINDDLVMMQQLKGMITMNRPIYTGFCILE